MVRNAPYILGFRAASNALAGGNTVVLKGPEASPRCTWVVGSVFKEAGLPDGCLNIIHHRPQDAAEVTTALIEHPLVKKINFTGSTAVGSIIAATAGKNLKPVLMELGGKASAIVLKDADIDLAAKQCAIGAFAHVCPISLRGGNQMLMFQRAAKSAWRPSAYWSTHPLWLHFPKP